MTVLVFGSINMDLVTRTPRLPIPGETLTGHSFMTVPGGKGANQAVAVARLGVSTQLVGRVGGDGFGQELLASLKRAGVGCDRVWVDPSTSSGIATIAVDDRGENHIVIVPGANGHVGVDDCERMQALLPTVTVVLLQLEVPYDAVIGAAQRAKQAGVMVMLDPAPAPSVLPDALYAGVDILTPNQIEASQLVGFTVHDLDTAANAATLLHQKGIPIVLLKLGRLGVFCSTPDEHFHIPAFSVPVVDTVAAGDAFNGGLAAALTQGLPLRQATRYASAVAALSVSKAGAQPSMPTRDEVATFLQANP